MPSLFSLISRFNLVRRIPLFSKLNWLEIRRIARKSIVEEYQKGDIIRCEGDPPDYFYCLISGRIKSYTSNTEGFKENLEFIHRGMHFGIISVLTAEDHAHTYEAINDSMVLKIPQEDFQAFLRAMPSLAVELSHSLSRRVRSQVKGLRHQWESKIIAIYSPIKGTGSSTYALHLALSLREETKKKVVFVRIHADRQEFLKSQESKEDISPAWRTPSVELKNLSGDHDKIFESIVKEDLGIDLLNVIFDPRDAALKKQISPLVSSLGGQYPYVVVDLPNEMDEYVLEAVMQADIVHLVSLDRQKDLESTASVVERIQATFKERFHKEKIRIIIRAQEQCLQVSLEEIQKIISYYPHYVLPFIFSHEFIEQTQSKNLIFHRAHEHSEYAKAITRLARQIGEVMVGLVLGGGAALGIAHIGVLRVLEQENIPIDVVVGSSMGAIIGGLWVTGNNVHQIETIAKEFGRPWQLTNLIDPIFPKSALIGGIAIEHWLRKHLDNLTFADTRIPFKIVAYDLIRREELVLDEGPLVAAIRKSVAIPGVVKSIKNNDQLIIDGGVLNPLPTNVLVNMGIKKIIAVNVLQSPEDVSMGYDLAVQKDQEMESISFQKAPFEYIKFRFWRAFFKIMTPNISDIIVRTLQATEYVIAERSGQKANILIHPNLVGIKWFHLYKVDHLIKSGEKATLDLLPRIKKLIEE